MNFETRLKHYAFPGRPASPRIKRRRDGLTPNQYKRLAKKDRRAWAVAQSNETTRDHR